MPTQVFSLGKLQQRQWLTDRLEENSCEEEKGRLNTTYIIAGRNVCQLSWCKVYMISQRRVSRILTTSVLHGRMVVEHGNKGEQRLNTKSENAKTWRQSSWRQTAAQKSDTFAFLGNSKGCLHTVHRRYETTANTGV